MIPGGLNMMCLGGKTILAYDDFSDADNTQILNKALDIGGNWRLNAASPSPIVLSGKAVMGGNNTNNWMATAELPADCKVSMTYNVGGTGGYLYPMLRWNGTALASAGSRALRVEIIQGNNLVKVQRVVDGISTTLASQTVNHVANTDYNLVVTLNGSSINVVSELINITTTTTITNAGGYGSSLIKGAAGVNSSSIDNFKVETL